ncbi:response regulator transcription factor [Cohnella cellulosilytica]|uniref:Response regulator n=1 Tax=Cohnella cellulosilytica TaxID=986710 RepID=A0ABW2F5N0_9BACL
MHKIIFIDDEATNLELLERVLDWKELGFEVAGTASDGREGLELFRRVRPAAVIADIRMPVMDGMDFIREARQLDARARVIVLSAYGEFEYARQAIEYGVHSYLLKPINENKLADMLRQIGEELKQERSARSEETVRRLLRELERPEEEAGKRVPELAALLEELGIRNGAGQLVYCAEEKLGGKEEAPDGGPESPVRRADVAACAVALAPGATLLVCPPEPPGSQGRLARKLREHGGAAGKARCGISTVRTFPEGFARAYREAAEAAEAGFYEEADCAVVQYGEGARLQPLASDEFIRRKWALLEKVQSGNAHSLSQWIREALSEFGGKPTRPSDLRRFCEECIVLVREELGKLDGEFADMLAGAEASDLQSCFRFGSLLAFMEEIAVKASSAIRSVQSNNKNYALIRKAKEYVLEHYDEESFTIQDVADHVGLSKNHFSKIYKDQTGENFWDYVIRFRLEQAKKWLRETSKTNYEIACLIGYSSEYHFSRMFAKETGMTTTQYRKRYGS